MRISVDDPLVLPNGFMCRMLVPMLTCWTEPQEARSGMFSLVDRSYTR